MKRSKSHVSIVDIANLVGCTAASVSLVLSNSPLPSQKMRARVRLAAAELGYVPNRMAQSLQRGRTFTLGVVMPYCADSHVSAFLDAFSAEAAEFGFQLEIHFHRWSVAEEERILQTLGEARMEAILLSGSRLSYESIGSLEMLRGQKIPIIGLNRREVAAFTSSIVVEREAGAAILGEYLGKQGHVICDYLEPTFSREVLENDQSSIHAAAQRLKEGMQQAGVEAQVDFFRTPEKYLQARQDIEHHGFSAKSASDICDLVINDYLDQRTGATAVVTPDIVIAWKLMAAMHHRGLRCPEDISIASFSVAGIGAMGAIPLTTVEYSVDYMSRKAMAAILGAIAGKKIAPVIKVPVELVGRDSCRAISKAVPARRSLVKNR